MYYWSETVSATSLEKEFLSFGGIREIYIGTAFFSAEGLRILRDLVEKNNLKRSKIHIYLSDEFSQFGQQLFLVGQFTGEMKFVAFLLHTKLFPDIENVVDTVAGFLAGKDIGKS